MTVEVRREAVVLSLEGRLDAANSRKFDELLLARLAQGNVNFIVDFSNVEYMSSLTIRVFYTYGKLLKIKDGRIVIVNPQPLVKKVLDLVEMHRDFPVYPDVDSARAAFLA
ncbi:MAG: STAS domain-containing protein [Elusimicrobiaceae bacterium]